MKWRLINIPKRGITTCLPDFRRAWSLSGTRLSPRSPRKRVSYHALPFWGGLEPPRGVPSPSPPGGVACRVQLVGFHPPNEARNRPRGLLWGPKMPESWAPGGFQLCTVFSGRAGGSPWGGAARPQAEESRAGPGPLGPRPPINTRNRRWPLEPLEVVKTKEAALRFPPE